jgi:hypothetical protein
MSNCLRRSNILNIKPKRLEDLESLIARVAGVYKKCQARRNRWHSLNVRPLIGEMKKLSVDGRYSFYIKGKGTKVKLVSLKLTESGGYENLTMKLADALPGIHFNEIGNKFYHLTHRVNFYSFLFKLQKTLDYLIKQFLNKKINHTLDYVKLIIEGDEYWYRRNCNVHGGKDELLNTPLEKYEEWINFVWQSDGYEFVMISR